MVEGAEARAVLVNAHIGATDGVPFVKRGTFSMLSLTEKLAVKHLGSFGFSEVMFWEMLSNHPLAVVDRYHRTLK